jgi:VWFA-related protein
MTRSARCLLIASFACSFYTGRAQQQPPSIQSPTADTPQASEPTQTLHTSTQLVIVDVVVEDRNGRPVHGLTRDNFVLTEQRKPQAIRNFEEHSATSDKKPGQPKPKLPPGVFTNYTPVAPGNTLNVLLIDSLNTPVTDQVFLRQQLLDYIKREKPGTNIAIFGLANRLIMLQGFTTDPAVLRTAVEHLNTRGALLLNDPAGTGIGDQTISDQIQDAKGPQDPAVLANLRQWEAEQASLQTQMRSELTLDAFNSLAHYLSNFPGRKNLIWFSGSFPLNIEPDTSIKDPFGVAADSNQELRQTANLLAAAQTAVYPVDARGLQTEPTFDVSQSPRALARNPTTAYTQSALTFDQSQADEHITMETMARYTGGHAFYNTNGLADAAASAIDAGSNYYTLTYTPADRNWDSGYRNIRVELAGRAAAQGMKLTYRPGYYADEPKRPSKPKGTKLQIGSTPAALSDPAAQAYSRVAISRGAPQPEDIVFKVRVVPLTGVNADTLAPDNQADRHGKMKPPYRTFAVDYVAPPSYFSMTPQSDGRHTGAIEFGIFVYDAEGHLLNISDKQVSLNLPPDTYKAFKADAVRLQLLVSAPVRQESFLRLIIHDIPSNHYGVVEIPTAEVRRLPALEAQSVPVSGDRRKLDASPETDGKQ